MSSESLSEGNWDLVVVGQLSKGWFKHTVHDIVSEEVHRVLDDDHGQLNPLIEHDHGEPVLVIDFSLSPFEISGPDDWSEETIVHDLKLSVELDNKVFEVEDHHAVLWEDVSVDLGISLNLPLLDGWARYLEHLASERIVKGNLGVKHIKGWSVVLDVVELHLIFDEVEEETEVPFLMCFEIDIECEEVRQELLHGSHELLDCFLFHSETHSNWLSSNWSKLWHDNLSTNI